MAQALSWERQAQRLVLRGHLDRDSLLPLWQQRQALLEGIEVIDVAALERVDSAGLALLVHLREQGAKAQRAPHFSGISDKLDSLITLYNLQQFIVSADKTA
ncbi:lipid asymmetry maintenance protein MlaB [Pantoea sp. A4]|uniref:lipid asymmetry maintenance protein MlaB n=1 Tax=Pantoea sp. A4 TaxID=1225184 RepID=UPI00037FF516|nr:lipid asymmetry maintenance protein MlaB [Pantoea sp. A4]